MIGHNAFSHNDFSQSEFSNNEFCYNFELLGQKVTFLRMRFYRTEVSQNSGIASDEFNQNCTHVKRIKFQEKAFEKMG